MLKSIRFVSKFKHVPFIFSPRTPKFKRCLTRCNEVYILQALYSTTRERNFWTSSLEPAFLNARNAQRCLLNHTENKTRRYNYPENPWVVMESKSFSGRQPWERPWQVYAEWGLLDPGLPSFSSSSLWRSAGIWSMWIESCPLMMMRPWVASISLMLVWLL